MDLHADVAMAIENKFDITAPALKCWLKLGDLRARVCM